MNRDSRLWTDPKLIARVRVGVGVWLLILCAVQSTVGNGGWWEWILVGIAALHFYLAYRLHTTNGEKGWLRLHRG